MNGAMVIDPKGNIIARHPIPQDTVLDMLKAFPDSEIEFISETHTLSRGTMETKIEKFKRFGFREIPGSPLRLRDFVTDFCFNCTDDQILSEKIYKINTSFNNEADSRKMDDFLIAHTDTLTNAPTIAGMYEITAKGISKAVGVAELARHLGIKEEETAVYGDGLNDLEMLKYFANSYAMENGCEEAKEAAHYQIGTNKDHAVVFHILNELGL
jgi:hydroxymethylpyrimidine pyrophosphatase-like HAD family hydrolase